MPFEVGAIHKKKVKCINYYCLQGHQNLWTPNQILHRDISPGNVFIALDPAQDSRGFVSDLDIAKVPPTLMPELPHATRSVKKALLLSRKHGPDITVRYKDISILFHALNEHLKICRGRLYLWPSSA